MWRTEGQKLAVVWWEVPGMLRRLSAVERVAAAALSAGLERLVAVELVCILAEQLVRSNAFRVEAQAMAAAEVAAALFVAARSTVVTNRN